MIYVNMCVYSVKKPNILPMDGEQCEIVYVSSIKPFIYLLP